FCCCSCCCCCCCSAAGSSPERNVLSLGPSARLRPACSRTCQDCGRPASSEGEVGVYVNLTRVSTSDQPIENATIVGEEMVRWLRDIEGYRGFLMLSREGTTLGLSFWETREMAERHR